MTVVSLAQYGYLETPYLSEFPYLQPASEVGFGMQFASQINIEKAKAFQVQGVINDEVEKGLQSEFVIFAENDVGFQFLSLIDFEKAKAFQAQAVIDDESIKGIEAQLRIFKELNPGFEFLSFINADKIKGAQLLATIDKSVTQGIQFRAIINDENVNGFQFQSMKEAIKAFQFRSVIYNTTNLRILKDFPSRGLTGSSWTSTSTAPSSTNGFSVNNLNTDIVEQYWRSETGVTSVTLTCDTGIIQGVFVDTLAILNHNLSGSTTVILQSSNDNFATIGTNIELTYESLNLYYIAPELPVSAYQYWRLIISDPGSSEGFLRIGTIIFGSAIIFSEESFVDRVRFGQKQFIDQVYTEGFTNISNDRGKKRNLSLEFRNLAYRRANFQQMRDLFDYAGVTLKCLYIPVPQQASRFAVFGKLNEIPIEEHNYKGADADYVDFSLEVDESL
jgi:hypothetical protein